MKLDDLMEYEARNVTPLFTNLGDLKILAAPPPAGCAVLINILKILKGKENIFHNNHSDPSYQYKSCLVKKKEKKRKKRKKKGKKGKKRKTKKKKKEKKKERKKRKKVVLCVENLLHMCVSGFVILYTKSLFFIQRI